MAKCVVVLFPWQPPPFGTLSRSAGKCVWVNLRYLRVALVFEITLPCCPEVILTAGVFGVLGYDCWVTIAQHSVRLQQDCFQKAAPRDNLTSKEVKTKSKCLRFSHVPACVWV